MLKNEKEEILYQLQEEQQSLATERENVAFLTSSLAELRQQEHAQISSEQHLQRKHQEQVDSLLNKMKSLERQNESFKAQSEELTMLRLNCKQNNPIQQSKKSILLAWHVSWKTQTKNYKCLLSERQPKYKIKRW